MRKNIFLLGSTGSIGTQALGVVLEQKDRFEVEVLTSGSLTSINGMLENYLDMINISYHQIKFLLINVKSIKDLLQPMWREGWLKTPAQRS